MDPASFPDKSSQLDPGLVLQRDGQQLRIDRPAPRERATMDPADEIDSSKPPPLLLPLPLPFQAAMRSATQLVNTAAGSGDVPGSA